MNFITKQWFYLQFFFGRKRGNPSGESTFFSISLTDGQWNYDTWYFTTFRQKYGCFNFRARLDGNFTEITRPALWLVNSDKYYSEIDIELTVGVSRPYLVLTTWWNPNSNTSEGAVVERIRFDNNKFIRSLQRSFHNYTIEWNEGRIRFYIDGLVCAELYNVPKEEMCVVVGESTIEYVEVSII